ncbi:MAG: hypothetical protein ACOY4W_16685 [Thermodesulfobacteriota bacterium]
MGDEFNQLMQLAGGFAKMRGQADDEKYKALRTRLAEEEMELAEAMKPFHMAQMESETALKKIQADTARWDGQRRQAADAFGKWQAMAGSGNKQQADQLAVEFYNSQVFDGVQAERGEKGGFILTDAKGNKTEWNPTDEEIGQAWAGYISDDPVKFYQTRKDEELARFNVNYNATMNRKVFMDDGGNLAWWTDGVDIKTGRAKGMGVDGSGRQYAAPQELEQKGFRYMGSIDELAKDPERLETYLNARDSMEARHLEQKLFRNKQLIEAETDQQKKTAMIEAQRQGLAKLEYLERRSGKTADLSSAEMARVESHIRTAWNNMDEVQTAQYESYDQFADAQRTSLVQQLKAEKKASLMSGFLATDGSASVVAGAEPGEKPAPARGGWKNWTVADKTRKEDKPKQQPNLATIAGGSGGW